MRGSDLAKEPEASKETVRGADPEEGKVAKRAVSGLNSEHAVPTIRRPIRRIDMVKTDLSLPTITSLSR